MSKHKRYTKELLSDLHPRFLVRNRLTGELTVEGAHGAESARRSGNEARAIGSHETASMALRRLGWTVDP